MITRLRFGSLAALGAVCLLAACASKTTVPSDIGLADAPDWVNQGNQALAARGDHLLHGIGLAPSMDDLSLQMSVADERARAEVARVLSSFMNVVSNDYAAAAGINNKQRNQASASRQIENFTRQNVSGARIVAHWRNPRNGSLWSLAELDLQKIKGMVARSDAMNAGFKRYFKSHADNMFGDFSPEEK